MSRRAFWLVAFCVAAVFCWLFPPFHVVPLRHAQERRQQAAFDASAFAAEFWEKQLLPATGRAVPVTDLLAALAQEPDAARKRLGRSPGLSATTFFFVRGAGRIASVEKDGLRIALEGAAAQPAVVLVMGLLFGNAVRDATGLLSGSDFPNSQDFNAISTELNRLVETRVLPDMRARAAVGKTIRFTGCLELEEDAAPSILRVVPVKVEWP